MEFTRLIASARLAVGWCVATLAGMGGLYASFQLDVPTGAAIVCVLGIALVSAAGAAKFRQAQKTSIVTDTEA
jgi:ABC-type Mn2+/Zn2+ transport system permease subunit